MKNCIKVITPIIILLLLVGVVVYGISSNRDISIETPLGDLTVSEVKAPDSIEDTDAAPEAETVTEEIHRQSFQFDMDFSPHQVLSSSTRYEDCGVKFQNTKIYNRYAVSPPHTIVSADTANPISIYFPNGANYVSVQIDTDGHNSKRQPAARIFNSNGNLIQEYLFPSGSSVATFENPDFSIARIDLGKLSHNRNALLRGSDSYDNLIFRTRAVRQCAF